MVNPADSRSDDISSTVARKLCAGSLTPLFTHLVEAAGLDPQDIQRLREQVERLDAERRHATRREDDE